MSVSAARCLNLARTGRSAVGAKRSGSAGGTLARRDLAKPFAEFLFRVMRDEGLGEATIERLVKLLQSVRNNLRAALQAIETGAFA